MQDDQRQAAARANAPGAAIGAALMLFYGFYVSPIGLGDSQLYNASVDVFRWTLRIGGLALATIAAACFAGFVTALAIDAVVSGLIGIIFLCCALIWLPS